MKRRANANVRRVSRSERSTETMAEKQRELARAPEVAADVVHRLHMRIAFGIRRAADDPATDRLDVHGLEDRARKLLNPMALSGTAGYLLRRLRAGRGILLKRVDSGCNQQLQFCYSSSVDAESWETASPVERDAA